MNRLIVLFLIIASGVLILPEESLALPWYGVPESKEIKISIYFKDNVEVVDPIYFYHLNFISENLRRDSGLSVFIENKYGSEISGRRVLSIKRYLQRVQQVSEKQISILNTEQKFFSSKGEKFSVYLSKNFSDKEIQEDEPKEEVQEPAVEEVSQDQNAEPLLDKSLQPLNAEEGMFYSYLGHAKLNFSDQESINGVQLGLGLHKKILGNMTLVAGVSLRRFSGAALEQRYSLGFNNQYEKIFLNTRVYFKKNNLLNKNTFKVETVEDFGVHQKVGILILKTFPLHMKVAFSGDFSFSNSVESLNSYNILSYSTDIEFVWRNFKTIDLSLFLFRTVRTYKKSSNYEEKNYLNGIGLKIIF